MALRHKSRWRLLCLLVSLLCCGLNAATIAWDASANATGYRLWRSIGSAPFSAVVTVTATSATVSTDTTQSNRFYVTAFNLAAESQPSAIVTVSPVPSEPPPTSNLPPAPVLRANRINGGRLDLGFTGVPDAVTEIERSIEGAPFTRIAIVPAGVLHYSDTSVRKKYDYRYRSRARNNYGYSNFSNELIFSSR